METQEPNQLAHRPTGSVLTRRTALKRLAGGAVAGVLNPVRVRSWRRPADSRGDIYPQPIVDTHPSVFRERSAHERISRNFPGRNTRRMTSSRYDGAQTAFTKVLQDASAPALHSPPTSGM